MASTPRRERRAPDTPGNRRTLAGAIALTALLLAASALTGSPPAAAATSPELSSLTGSYLAARHARNVGDETSAGDFLLGALARSPDDAVLMRRAHLVLLLDGRIEEGLRVAERYLATGADAYVAKLALAVGDVRDGRLEEADQRLAALTSNPLTEFLMPMMRAWVLAGRGQHDKANEVLASMASNSSTDPFRHLHASLIADAKGDTETAASRMDMALADQPEPWVRLVHLAARIYHRAGRLDAARAILADYARRHPESNMVDAALARLDKGGAPPAAIRTTSHGVAEALFNAAGALARQQGRETALILGQLGLYLRPDFPSLHLLVGDLLESTGRLSRANALYAAIDPASPFSWTARLNIARNLDEMDRFDEAAALLRDLARERPEESRPLSELADMLRRRDRFEAAVATYDEAVDRIETLEPRHWRLLYARGVALERAKKWPRAEADFLKALEFEPDQPFVLNYLGYSWVEQGRNLEKAEEMIRKAVDLRPTDGYIVDSLGWVLYRLGRHEEAAVELERAVELRPDDPVINDHLGDAYWSVGRQREARFQWRTALDLQPEPELRAAIGQKLRQGLVKEANAAAP